LKILSDPSEEVIKYDLQLLSQMSSSSEEWFNRFTSNLLLLFGTDQALFQSRGSLIIRLLCINLSTEKVYKTFAELLEKEEVSKQARSILCGRVRLMLEPGSERC
jgi:vacuole morphology and inheritance protein 14